MARIYGIDLGAHTIKVAELEGSFGRFQLMGYRERRVPEPEDRASNLDERVAVLSEMLDEEGTRDGATYGVGFPSEHASLRVVSLPFGDRAKVEQALSFEVEGQVPFDLEDMVLTSRILQVEPGNSKVLAGLAERDRVGALLADLKISGADPKLLVIDADLLGDHAGDGVQAVIDIGHTRTLVALCQDKHVIAARALNGGGRELTQALAEAFDLDFASAEARKHGSGVYADGEAPPAAAPAQVTDDGLDDIDLDAWAEEDTNTGVKSADPTLAPEPLVPPRPTPTLVPSRTEPGVEPDANAVLRDAILPLMLELRTSLIHFEDTHDLEIGEIVLAGGGAELGGLRAWLGSVLGVPVRKATVSPEADRLTAPSRFALADSVGRKAAGGKGRLLDLRQEGFAYKGDLQVLGTVLRWGAAAMALFMVGGVAWFGYRAYQLNAEVAALETEIADVVVGTFPDVSRSKVEGSTTTAKAIMMEKTSETTAQVDALGSVISDEPPVLGTMREISQGMPDHSDAVLDVTELSISSGTISMKVETGGFEDAAKIESSLKAQPRFKQAQKGDEKKRREKVRFTITIPLEGDESEEG
jgi:type IV pilus assembly protein PilM